VQSVVNDHLYTTQSKEAAVKTLHLFALLTLVSTLGFGQVNFQFEQYDLPNGLHVILHPDHSAPIVSQAVVYHVGSKNEQADRTGFAHFFEHLMFEGTPYIGRGEFFKMVQNAGGELNASTSFDQTIYYITLPANQLEKAMWMESGRMAELKIDSVGVETQRGVVKEERKQGLENRPYGTILEKTMASSFRIHPYRWVPIGSAQYIDRASIEEFLQFYRRYYVPDNACLVIAGDIDIPHTKELIAKYYGGIPRGLAPIVRPKEVEPPQAVEVRDTVYDNIQLPAVILAYHMPAQGTEDSYALSMLTTLLTGGESSRLTKRLVDKDKLAVVVRSIPLSLEDPGLFLALAIANFGKTLPEVEKVIQQEIDRVQKDLITEAEFQKIRNQRESEFIQNNSTVQGKAVELANYHLFFGDAGLINTELTRYMKVTREDIRRVAQQYLKHDARTVLYYLPKAQGQ
jgi:zinc protease